jgi:hypothetical protein
MSTHQHTPTRLQSNRAPVRPRWAAVVAERLGCTWDKALTLGRAAAGLNAYTTGTALGLGTPTPLDGPAQRQAQRGQELRHVDVLHRAVPVTHTAAGLRVLSTATLIEPAHVQRSVQRTFGEVLADASAAMPHLAASLPPSALAAETYQLYKHVRPAMPARATGEYGGRRAMRVTASHARQGHGLRRVRHAAPPGAAAARDCREGGWGARCPAEQPASSGTAASQHVPREGIGERSEAFVLGAFSHSVHRRTRSVGKQSFVKEAQDSMYR